MKKLASRNRQFLITRSNGSGAILLLAAILLAEFRKGPLARVLCTADKSAMEAAEVDHTGGILCGVGCGNERRLANYFPYDFHILDIANVLQLARGALLLRA